MYKVMALDVGTKRIGIALSDYLLMLANGHSYIPREPEEKALETIYKIAKEVEMPIEMHFHNDLGMAVACSVMGAKAAIDAGVDAWINTAINGMGERAGNADLVSCILAILKSSGFLSP